MAESPRVTPRYRGGMKPPEKRGQGGNTDPKQTAGLGVIFAAMGLVFMLTMDTPAIGLPFIALGLTFVVMGISAAKKARNTRTSRGDSIDDQPHV
jgi:hypothetical protein